MTITREQVEAMARLLAERAIGTGCDDLDEAAAMLRDLWQRVEQSEARIVELEAARPEILR